MKKEVCRNCWHLADDHWNGRCHAWVPFGCDCKECVK